MKARSSPTNPRICPGLRIWYYRPLPEEPPLPDDLPVLYEDEHLLAVDNATLSSRYPARAYVAQTALTKLRVRENNPLLTPVHRAGPPHRRDLTLR